MYYGLLNVGSLALGLTAWAVPVWYIGRLAKGGTRTGWPGWVSMGCCGLSLWLQLCYNRHLVEIQDWSALLDTVGAVVKVAGVLLITTGLLNAAVLWMERYGEREGQA